MLHIGLTGGIASGKSTVARIFRSLGAIIIDLDLLAREVIDRDGPARREVLERFGEAVLNPDGTINRSELGRIVFDRGEDMAVLNAIIHPHVLTRWHEQLEAIKEERPAAVVVSDVPLLVEAGLAPLFDLVILVYIPVGEQYKRLMKRNGLTRKEAMKRLAAQLPIDEKIKYAQAVIDNEGEVERLRAVVERLWQDLAAREL
ncbi:MAG: dephospho-CoA kinase [Smithellaceae bacterium]|nr:dephospho-CoA kinase [Smithellaceae bacterium]